MDNATVVKAHVPDSSTSLIMKQGDILQGERRKTDWAGWLWCTSDSGVSAWVPEVFLSKLPEGNLYHATCDYNSRELKIGAGQDVEIISTTAEWAWVRTGDDDEGWIPLENLEYLPK